MALYRAAILQFGYFNDGLYDLQDPVPGVLPEPSENFVRAHNLSGVLDLFFELASGVGDTMRTPLLHVLQDFGPNQVDTLATGFITPVESVAALYKSAANAQGVLHQSTV